MYGAMRGHSPPLDESRLPRGVCRFILLHPEVTGQRCSCQGYALNTSVMGSACECGHQACYHVPEQENESIARRELNALMARVISLENELERERSGRNAPVHERIIAVEEVVENFKAEQEENTKIMYRAMARAYNSIREYQMNNSKRFLEYDDKLDSVADKAFAFRDELESVQNHVGRIEDSVMGLEDCLEDLESEVDNGNAHSGRPRKRIKVEPRSSRPSSSPIKLEFSEKTEPDEDLGATHREPIINPKSDLQESGVVESAFHEPLPLPSDPPPPVIPNQMIPEPPVLSQEPRSVDRMPSFRIPLITQATSEAPVVPVPLESEPMPVPMQPPSPSLTPINPAASRSPSLPMQRSDLPSPPASVSLTPDDLTIDVAPVSDSDSLLPPPLPATSTTGSPRMVPSINGTGSPRGFKRANICRTAPGVRCQGMCQGQTRRGVV